MLIKGYTVNGEIQILNPGRVISALKNSLLFFYVGKEEKSKAKPLEQEIHPPHQKRKKTPAL
jgi:hypothetical protein